MSKRRRIGDDKQSYWTIRRKSIKQAKMEVDQMIQDEQIAPDKANHDPTEECHAGSSNSPSQDAQPMEEVINYIVLINLYSCYLNFG